MKINRPSSQGYYKLNLCKCTLCAVKGYSDVILVISFLRKTHICMCRLFLPPWHEYVPFITSFLQTTASHHPQTHQSIRNWNGKWYWNFLYCDVSWILRTRIQRWGYHLGCFPAASNRIPPLIEISIRNHMLRLGLFEEGFIKGLYAKMWDWSGIKGLVSAELFSNSSRVQRGRGQLLEPKRRLLQRKAPSEKSTNLQLRT